MKSTSALLFMHTLTSLHPGTGSALGAIVLPVQREKHTGWPLIPGSTIKGVLRDKVRLARAEEMQISDLQKADEDDTVTDLFGKSVKKMDSPDKPGAMDVTDARILLFPVRSSKGLFAYVTCPEAIRRFQRDANITGVALNGCMEMPTVSDEEALVCEKRGLCFEPGEKGYNMVLEEFEFKGEENGYVRNLATTLNTKSGLEGIEKRLALVTDDTFAYFTRHGTEVTARIALEPGTKNVSEGALFYEEFVPPEAVFYSMILLNEGKAPGGYERIDGVFGGNGVLQIGGDASIGKGLCECKMVKGGRTS